MPELRGGGRGELIWAMPESKHSFFKEVIPYGEMCTFLMKWNIYFSKSVTNNFLCKAGLHAKERKVKDEGDKQLGGARRELMHDLQEFQM